MAVSEIEGMETSQPLVLKLLQALLIIETRGLWTWGVLLLALAATLVSILNTHRLLPRLGDAGSAQQIKHSPGAGFSLDSLVEEDERASDDGELTAAPCEAVASDSDHKTKGQLCFEGEEEENEEQLEGIERESGWDLSSGEIVKVWPHSGSHTTIKPPLRNNFNQRPAIVVTKNGDIGVRDPRVRCQTPAMMVHRPHPRKPVSEIWYDRLEEILFGDDITICDLRMITSNCDDTVMSRRDFNSLWWDDDAVIIPSDYDRSQEDEFQIVDYGDSLKLSDLSRSVAGMSSTSMVLRCLNAVRSISSGLRN